MPTAGRGYTFPQPGEFVSDKEADEDDESIAICVQAHADVPANDRWLSSMGKTVADVNRDYPEDAPIVTVAFLDDIEEDIDNWTDVSPRKLRSVLKSRGVSLYDYPAPRLQLLAVKADLPDNDEITESEGNAEVTTDSSSDQEMSERPQATNGSESSLGSGEKKYDLSTAPDLPRDMSEDDDYVQDRARYLERVSSLRRKLAKALAYAELGYSHHGIAKKMDTSGSTVQSWFEEIEDEYGEHVLESRPQHDPIPELE